MTSKPPIDTASLERMALHYAGRYATSRAGLRRYLRRKIAERGWAGGGDPPVERLVERCAALGYVDDRAVAEARGRSLARRGYGARRVAAALDALGIGQEDGAATREAARDGAWETALRFAERRRLGPFASAASDEATRRRAMAAMLRAGHSLEHARRILAASPGSVPRWDE